MTQPLDHLGPHRGPCGICGGPDARHRLGDAVAGRVAAGESAESVAADLGLDAEAVRKFLLAATATEKRRPAP